MAVTKTDLTVGSNATGTDSANTASISPSANKLILIAVVNEEWAGTADIPTVSGCGLTWVEIDNRVMNSDKRLTVFRAMGASPSTGALTIDFATAQDGIAWSVFELGNVDTTGTNGSGAIQQSVTTGGTSDTNPSITLSAFDNSNNATVGLFGWGDAFTQNPTAGSGFTEIHDQNVNGVGNTRVFTEWKTTNDTSVDCSVPTFGLNWSGIALEIVEFAGVLKTHTTDTYLVPNKHYTREAKTSLPTDDTNLATVYSSSEKSDVASDDATRVDLSAGDRYLIHEFKALNEARSNDNFTITWNGQASIAPSSKTVKLQVYNRNTPGWEDLDSDSATGADTDFTLEGTISTNPGYYYDGNYVVACRVYQDTN